ncbi:MAG: hypothetical protein ACOYOV_03935 [Bacteroidales bacterium]
MKKRFIFFILLSFVSLVFIECSKENHYSGGGGTVSSIKVLVLSEDGTPLPGVEVSCGTVIVTSANDGTATLDNVETSNEKYIVSVKKLGFFKGFKNILKTDGTTTYSTEINLIQKEMIGTVDANNSASLNGNQFRVEINGQGFKDLNGTTVNGAVSVYARYIPANDLQQLSNLMPGGDFSATNQSTNGILESYGFTAIEFLDASGNKVIPNSGNAYLAIQLPANALAQLNSGGANAWYFNETTSTWEGSQSLTPNGNEVYIPVTASTFGNCDRMNSKAKFKAHFYCTDQNSPIAGKKITLTGKNGYAMIYTSFSNDNGNVLIEVGVPPIGGSYEMKIDNYTANVNFTANQTTDLGSIDVCNLQGQDGNPRFNLKFSGNVDFDLHVKDPAGEILFYGHVTSASGGTLDLDNQHGGQENVFWSNGPSGNYEYWIVFYAAYTSSNSDYTLTVTNNGTIISTKTGTLNTVGQESQHYIFTK